MALRKSLSTFLQSSLKTTVCNSRIVNKNFNGGNSSSEFPPPPSPSLEIPKTAKIPFTTKRSLCDVSWEKSNTDLLPPPTPRPISREEVEAALKLLDDVSSVLNDFPWVTGANYVLPENSSGGSFDEEGVRDIIVDIAWRNRKTIGEIVELADLTFKRSKYEMDRLNGLIDEVHRRRYGFGCTCTLFGWTFSCELKGGKSRATDRQWETCPTCLTSYVLPELNALEEDFYYLENIKCVEDGVRYCLRSTAPWVRYLRIFEIFKVSLEGFITALQGLDQEREREK